MSVAWTINGASFASLGLSNLRRTRLNQGMDVVTFDAPAAALDSTAAFAYGATVAIARDGAAWFRGRINNIPRSGSPKAESVQYQVAGPWWYLENCVFQHRWKMYASGSLGWQYSSRVILCQDEDGTRLNAGQQVQKVVEYAIGLGADIAVGSIACAVEVPFDEVSDITCAEAIVRLLRWAPNHAAWFDYSVTPPTFNVAPIGSLAAVSYKATPAAGDTPIVNTILLTPRYDLQKPGVVLRYVQPVEATCTTTDDQTPPQSQDVTTFWNAIVEDTAGNTAALDCVVCTIDLAGHSSSTLVQEVETAAIDAANAVDATRLAWWKTLYPPLADARINNLVIAAAKVTRGAIPNYDNYLVKGTVQDWMLKGSGGKYHQKSETIKALIDYGVTSPDGQVPLRKQNVPITVTLTATDIVSGKYRKHEVTSIGEPAPVGLAAALFAAWGRLQWDGSVTLQEEECGTAGAVHPGLKLNLTAGLAAWAAMDALIQRVDEIVDSGQTTITVGPAKHLSPDELLALRRATRTRAIARSYRVRTKGDTQERDGSTELAGHLPGLDAAGTDGETLKQYISTYSTGTAPTHRIELDPTAMTQDGQVLGVKTVSGVVKGLFDWLRFHT
jgi:hypothetical protein